MRMYVLYVCMYASLSVQMEYKWTCAALVGCVKVV